MYQVDKQADRKEEAKLWGVERRAPPVFGKATIRLGIGPHSSVYFLFQYQVRVVDHRNLNYDNVADTSAATVA